MIASPVLKEAGAIVGEIASLGRMPVRLIAEARPGLSNARNQALKESASEYVAYFDDDVQVSPQWIEGFFEAVQSHAADCVVGPVSPVFEQTVPDYLQSEHALSHITSPYTQRGPRMFVLPPDVAHEVPGCNFGVRRQAAIDVGGFDPRLGSCGKTIIAGEDVEFGRQLVRAGKKVVYQPRCALGHVISAQKLSKEWFRPREYGGGLWRGMAAAAQGYQLTIARRVHFALGMARRFLMAVGFLLLGRRAAAFEQEVRIREAVGFLLGFRQRSRELAQERRIPASRRRMLLYRIEERFTLPRRGPFDLDQHMQAAVDWILRAQGASRDDGVPESYNVATGLWTPSYPETTGYIICTLLRAAAIKPERADELRAAARRMGRWLLTTQMPDGAFPAGTVAQLPRQPAVFNTGQILKGLTDLIRGGLDEDGQLANAAAAAARWMVGQQNPDGAWRRGVSPLTTEPVHSYYVRAAWPLARYGTAVGDTSLVDAAVRSAEWVLSMQGPDGWIPHMNFNVDENPLTHCIAYTLQGLLEIGILCRRTDLVDAAARAARQVLAAQDPKTGSLPGRFSPGYRPAARWSSSTGNAQMTIVWFRLAAITGDATWHTAAERANEFNCSIQDLDHRDPGRRGGLRSAWPGHLGYTPYKYTNWSQKFFVDALMAQKGIAVE